MKKILAIVLLVIIGVITIKNFQKVSYDEIGNVCYGEIIKVCGGDQN